MSIDQEYKDFSKWCRDNPAYDLDPRLHTHSGRINDGGYILHKRTGTAFKAWQASRQALEGEPIGFLQSSGVSQLSGGHPAKLYPIGATPSPFESSTLVYTHPASRQAVSVPEWIKCSDRLPTEDDGQVIWTHDSHRKTVELTSWAWAQGLFKNSYITHWMPTGMIRPQPPKQELGQ